MPEPADLLARSIASVRRGEVLSPLPAADDGGGGPTPQGALASVTFDGSESGEGPSQSAPSTSGVEYVASDPSHVPAHFIAIGAKVTVRQADVSDAPGRTGWVVDAWRDTDGMWWVRVVSKAGTREVVTDVFAIESLDPALIEPPNGPQAVRLARRILSAIGARNGQRVGGKWGPVDRTEFEWAYRLVREA